jgi:hypothetical protein
MAVFREQMRETPTKYKMLWFVVDTHHRQRYFFICGYNQTVMKNPGQIGLREAVTGAETCGSNDP